MPGKKSYNCCNCPRVVRQKDRYSIARKYRVVISKLSGRTPGDDDFLCNRCRCMCARHIKRKGHSMASTTDCQGESAPSTSSTTLTPQFSPPSVTLPFPCTSRGHAACCICKRPGPKLVVVPVGFRHRIFITKEVIIPAGARCCPKHLQRDIESLNPTARTTKFNKTSITELIKFLRTEIIRSEKARLDFDSENLTDTEYVDLLGISKASFNDMMLFIEGKIKITPARTTRTSLAIFLLKLRGGESNKILSTLFNISKSSIQRSVRAVRNILMTGGFVTENLGFGHITREEIINKHTRPLAQTLFGDDTTQQAILILDGTYIYINKSGNFRFQRQSYSLHKGRPLVKPMVIVSSTGYFVSVLGPYIAKNNDASILNHILKRNIDDIQGWVCEDDVFVVDRGFRDSLDYLEELGIKAQMPSFMAHGDRQMSTESANISRLVTKIRWVVESANGRIKQWRYLGKILPTSQVPYIGDFVRIVCAISNRYLKSISNGNAEDDQILGTKMIYLSKQINTLRQHVEENKLERRSACWEEMDDITDFPNLDEEQLRSLTCGTYQLKLSPSYAQEHIEGDCAIHVHKEEPGLVRIRMQSRHVSSRSYLLWIKYAEGAIIAWYCKCKAGARVVGMCAHIAAILWYVGYARHQPAGRIGVRDWGEFLEDATLVDESESSSEGSEIEE
ncbi:uncharacterized protein LOC125662931 [Ostrea edulis]|uniref:uncharacterized protein LOC125675259 n=1 Tax=Ostrea edulis TaxID=37623 RepID=UPI0020950BF2|nr:uncharacterized protein LOC125675259 [Ostrea edulis]XP_056003198.1 uncharacterized protein LOC125648984 [Ostrea edulis]XP_056003258.1 uncharacterized protein LOC130049513 [Ostrea edulis]XP_056019486.1 uncharacterized protein LOC125662931 [Ostrea edulis]